MKKYIGMIFICTGILFTMYNENKLHIIMDEITFYIDQYWTLLIIIIGFYLLLVSKTKKKRSRNK